MVNVVITWFSYVWLFKLCTFILIPGTLWLVSMADNGTEVISQGGEHGAVNGQYNTDSENG